MSDEKPDPPRCSKHKTAMYKYRVDGEWIEMACCLRGCNERTMISSPTYTRLYGKGG